MAVDQPVVRADADSLTIRKIGLADLRDALVQGYADFTAMPSHAVFLCVIYPIIGFVMIRYIITGDSLLPMVFPLVAGYALVGPFAAVGLYELSRRRELGIDASPSHIWEVFRLPTFGPVLELGAMLAFFFVCWLAAAHAIYYLTFHDEIPSSGGDFLREIFTTQAGWALIIVGNGVGFLFAAAVFSLGVVSFPLVLDRHVGAAEAMVTSLRAVAANPLTMAVWGLIIAVALVLGSIPFFIGLIVVMPTLGHASWHLYRKVVAH